MCMVCRLAADVNEVLLIDDLGAVEEGMSSNFFVVMGGAVYTADEGVLKGTVRELVLQVWIDQRCRDGCGQGDKITHEKLAMGHSICLHRAANRWASTCIWRLPRSRVLESGSLRSSRAHRGSCFP